MLSLSLPVECSLHGVQDLQALVNEMSHSLLGKYSAGFVTFNVNVLIL